MIDAIYMCGFWLRDLTYQPVFLRANEDYTSRQKCFSMANRFEKEMVRSTMLEF